MLSSIHIAEDIELNKAGALFLKSGTVNLSQPKYSKAMPPIDQNLISPLKVEPNDFQTEEYRLVIGSQGEMEKGTRARASNVKIGTQNSSKYLIKVGEVIYEKPTDLLTANGPIAYDKPADINMSGPFSLVSNESQQLLSKTQYVKFRAGENVSYYMSNAERFKEIGNLRVTPKITNTG